MDRAIITLQLTEKRLNSARKRHEKEARKELKKLKTYIEQNDVHAVPIAAKAVIRERSMRVQCMRLASQINGTVGKLRSQRDVMSTATAMGRASHALEQAAKKMDLQQMATVLKRFEKQDEDLDVMQMHVEETMQTMTSTSTPEQEVSELVQQVVEQCQLKLSEELSKAVISSGSEKVEKSASGNGKTLEERMNLL